ncbi:hypothetical protein [Streptomyces sp. NPDC005955]|uniref:hypothetical protein n=1 Tax=Streptomyces sp. NPDC005955 TaxID=3364738 RepID=UPI0036A9B1CD
MRLERLRPTVLRATLHVHELAALTTAARYVTESEPPGVPAEALEELRALLTDYDAQVRSLAPTPHPDAPPPRPPD